MIANMLASLLVLTLIAAAPAIQSLPTTAPAAPVKLILLTQSMGFEHDVVKRKDGQRSVVEHTFRKLADDTRLFDVDWTDDASTLTEARMAQARIIVFYTTGDLSLDVKALHAWITAGGTFIGVHSATDTLKETSAYSSLICAVFDTHPWTSGKIVTIKTDEPPELMHSAARPFAPAATFREEIYQFKNVDYDKIHVIMSLDMQKTSDPKRPLHVPIAWCRTYGKGNIFYTSLGHREDMWNSAAYQKHLVAAIRWGLGLDPGDATPNPQLHVREEQIAKEAAGG